MTVLGYRRRVENYRAFRRALPLPLLTVELSFDGAFAVTDADVRIRVADGDVMWQKERLLNVALSALPAACDEVLWVDADVLLPEPGRVSAALKDAALVQAFSRVEHLGPGGELLFAQPALAAAERPAERFDRVVQRDGRSHSCGFAWAARRELLQRHGFFDACILGGGDSAMAAAAFGCPEEVVARHAMNARQRAHYLAWAGGWSASVGGRVAALEGAARHLWHGAIADRRPGERHRDLGPFAFDPAADVAVSAGGAWRWASDKPGLHELARAYFAGRREDG